MDESIEDRFRTETIAFLRSQNTKYPELGVIVFSYDSVKLEVGALSLMPAITVVAVLCQWVGRRMLERAEQLANASWSIPPGPRTPQA